MALADYIAAAVQAARWLDTVALTQDRGLAWPADPRDPSTIGAGLYQGNAGVTVFYLELFRATGDPQWRDRAVAGGRYLLGRLERLATGGDPSPVPHGLYTGLAGIGFACLAIAKAGGGHEFSEAARRCVRLIEGAARDSGGGVQWPTDSPNPAASAGHPTMVPADIISGAAGIGLFLLQAHSELALDTRDLAAAAGRRLVEVGMPTAAGLDWRPGLPEIEYSMPNFSHGTAGVVYFLASLSMATGAEAFLAAARAGARHLQAIAYQEGDICLVPRTQPAQEDRADSAGGVARPVYGMGWCHGPMGVGATWYRLYQATGEEEWMTWLLRSARAYLPGHVPEAVGGFRGLTGQYPERTVCYCHGSAGNGSFLLNVYRATGQEAFREAGVALLDATLGRATEGTGPAGRTLTWAQSLARWDEGAGSYVTEWVPQSGFNTGVAGIGYALLCADAVLQGRGPAVRLLDNPFGTLPGP
jgi:lantibiotic modifying enzyme